jgi:hypothetical protein
VSAPVLSRHPALEGDLPPDILAAYAGIRRGSAWSLPRYFPLPVLIVCPACGLRQVLDAGVLGIA